MRDGDGKSLVSEASLDPITMLNLGKSNSAQVISYHLSVLAVEGQTAEKEMANENYTKREIVSRNCGPSVGSRIGWLRDDAQGGTLCPTAAWINVHLFAEQHGKLRIGDREGHLDGRRAHMGGKTDDGARNTGRSGSVQC